MCGIVGAVTLSRTPDIQPLLDAIRHRGPDQSAVLVRGACALGAARLAIVDPANGDQPMVDEATGTAIVFNGEIYNSADLRERLCARGHHFRTRCDTEVVLRGWIEWGPRLIGRLSGMFAFAISEPGRLTLVRDPLGIKPLRFAHLPADDTFLFASESKALFRHRGLSSRLDERAFADFVAIGYPTGERTFFAGVSTLPPGCSMTVTWDDGLRVAAPRRYDAPETRTLDGLTADDADEAFTAALSAAVESHLAADVEIVLLLSGGIDSAMLAFLAAELSDEPLRAFTVADDAAHPDAIAARSVAAAAGLRHTLLLLGFDDYLTAVPATIAAVEAPDLHAGPFLHALCRHIGGSAKACLNGEGADETLGGYYDREGTVASLTAGFRRAKANALAPTDRACEIRDRFMAAAAAQAKGVRAWLDVSLTDLLERAQLDPVDHISMASAVEMRVPYLDGRVQSVARSLAPTELVDPAFGITKRVLRRSAVRRYGAPMVDIALRRKMMMPEAADRHDKRFDQLCERWISDEVVRKSDFGACFATKRDFVLFEMFRQTCLSGAARSAEFPPMAEFLAELGGTRLTGVA